MREPIENEYFNWLCAKVLHDRSRTYYTLLLIMHKTEFIIVVPFDRHRAADGIELRQDFIREINAEPDDEWMDLPCSVLEMMLAFSKRVSFQTDLPTDQWFWEFMTNLNLNEFRHVSDSDVPEIERTLHILNWRTYDPRGNGGMFPLSQTDNDQREVEIWYQFCEYLDEKGLY
jgi:hypothetical protein